MNGCVNKNKEFYSLAKEHGIDGGELELIIHKYWNEGGKVDSFPSTLYISEQLGIGKTYYESGENVRKLWEKDYSRPIKFKSEYELNEAVKKAKTFFPTDTITTYKDNKGNFVLRVAEPVTSSSIDKEIQDILAKAPRDSQGRLLAPNGKVPNLTEKQYAQVRTKAFKRWFGDWENDPTNASKVVDENGEPLVVYHGSRDNSFTTFDSTKNDKGQKGFFFTNDRTMASSYGKNPREFFINSRNPYIIEGHNKNWNDLTIEVTDIAKDKLDSIRLFRNDLLLQLKEGKISKEIYDYWNDKYFKLYDKYLSLSNSFIDKIKKIAILNRLNKFEGRGNFLKSTRYTERVLELDSEDVNIIFKSITDYGPVFNEEASINNINHVAANVYVVTNPNNIKSATFNTGEFSTTNDDIRYRRADSERIRQYHRNKLQYGNLSQEQKDYIKLRNISIEDYNDMSDIEKEVLFHCMV